MFARKHNQMTNNNHFHEHKLFENIQYSGKTIRDREFYKCRFVACNFTESDLRSNNFEACIFEDCNFSMTDVAGVGFRDISFIGCKILGIDFTQCNRFMFSFRFENCILDYCTFFGPKLDKTIFKKCSLREVDFTEANLTSSLFTDSDLTGALFSNTNLEKTDFRGAANFSIDPEFNKMKNVKFTSFQLEGLLYKYQLDIE